MNNKFKQLLSDTFVFAIGNILSKLILFFLMPLYTSALTTDEFGVAELLNNSVELALPIASICIYEAVFRFCIDKGADHKKILSIGLSVLSKSFVIVFALMFVGSRFIKYEYTWYFALMLFTAALRQLFAQFARGIGHVKRFAFSGILNALMLAVFNIIFLAKFNLNISGYLISIILSNAISAVFLFFASKVYCYISLNSYDKILLKAMVIYSLPQIPNMLSWWVTNLSSRYIIAGFWGASMAGLFTAASKLPSLVNLLTTIFQKAWQFSSAKEIGEKGSDKFFSDVFKAFSVFMIISCSGLILFVPLISKFLLKGEFYCAWIYVPLLMISATINSYSVYFGTFYSAAMKNKMIMVSTIIGASISLGLCFITIPFIGIYGALIASNVSYFVIVIIRIIDTRKYAKINLQLKVNVTTLAMLLLQAILMTLNLAFSQILSGLLFMAILGVIMANYRKDISRIINKVMVALRKTPIGK